MYDLFKYVLKVVVYLHLFAKHTPQLSAEKQMHSYTTKGRHR